MASPASPSPSKPSPSSLRSPGSIIWKLLNILQPWSRCPHHTRVQVSPACTNITFSASLYGQLCFLLFSLNFRAWRWVGNLSFFFTAYKPSCLSHFFFSSWLQFTMTPSSFSSHSWMNITTFTPFSPPLLLLLCSVDFGFLNSKISPSSPPSRTTYIYSYILPGYHYWLHSHQHPIPSDFSSQPPSSPLLYLHFGNSNS